MVGEREIDSGKMDVGKGITSVNLVGEKVIARCKIAGGNSKGRELVGDSWTVGGKMAGGSEGLNAETFCTGLLFLVQKHTMVSCIQ